MKRKDRQTPTTAGRFINHHCTDQLDSVVPVSCKVCRSCWLFITGSKAGSCPYGGPFSGFAHDGAHSKTATPKTESTEKC